MNVGKSILLVVLLLLLGTVFYVNNTYVLNFTYSEFPVLIRRYYSIEIYQIGLPLSETEAAPLNPRTYSMLIMMGLSFVLTSVVVYFYFGSPHALRHHLFFSTLVTLAIALSYFIYIQSGYQAFYKLSSSLKLLYLSPVYLTLLWLLEEKVLRGLGDSATDKK